MSASACPEHRYAPWSFSDPTGYGTALRTTDRPPTRSTQLTTRVKATGRVGLILTVFSGITMALPLCAMARTTTSGPGDGPPQITALEQIEALTAAPDAEVTFVEGSLRGERTPPAVLSPPRGPLADLPRHAASVSPLVRPVGGTSRGEAVLAIARQYVGVPYRYGGTTPAGFDCSGYTRFVYARLGHTLPRTADQQMRATTRISRTQAVPGDLVFFLSGGRAHHIGIYAGGNQMYDAPRTGLSVTRRSIWSDTLVFTRVG